MQCPSCQFENLPGLPVCVRCHSPLGPLEIAVVPRRASALRLTTRLLRLWYGARSACGCFVSRVRPGPFRIRGPVPWSIVLCTLIPGLGHLHVGHRRAGAYLMVIWTGLILTAIVTVATPWANRALMAAATVHALTLLMLASPALGGTSLLWRVACGAALVAGVRYLAYGAVTSLASHIVCPYVLQNFRANPLLAEGDALLVRGNWLEPRQFQRGDLVLYEIPQRSDPAYYIRGGYGLDRILALPGEHISFARGVLTVNGLPLPGGMAPLADPPDLPAYGFTLGPREYGVWPSLLGVRIHGQAGDLPPDIARRLVVVERGRMVGRVFWRLRPWARFGPVQ